MGQGQSQPKQNQDYLVVQQLQVGDVVRNIKSQTLHFLREHTYNSQQAYQNALNSQSLKLSNKNEHLLNFQHFITKSETTFCSSFFKLTLIFEYVQYSLEKQLLIRIKDQRFFNEKQIWSILCSTVLAAVHLINYEGYMHCGLTTKDIRLNPDGCVKILNNEMIGIDKKHTQNEGTPKMLAITLIQCMTLKKLTNEQNSFLQTLADKLNYSSDMKDIIRLMIKQGQKFKEIQKELFKLARDNDSLGSYDHTPSIRSHSRVSSNLRGSSAKKESEKKKLISILNRFQQFQPMINDIEDDINFLFFVDSNQQAQIPDQLLQNPTSQISQDDISEQNKNIVRQNYFIPIKNITQSQNNSKSSQRSQKSHLQYYQINSALPSYRSQRQKRKNNTNFQEINKKQEILRQQPNKNDEIFTDPQFICRIKNDLQNIRIRREKQNSNEQRSREKSIVSSNILLQEISKFQSEQNSRSKVSNTSSKNNRKSTLSQYESKQNLNDYIKQDNLPPFPPKNEEKDIQSDRKETFQLKQENKNQKINIQTESGEQIFQYELTQSNSVTSGNSGKYYYISNSIEQEQGKFIHVNEQFNRGSYQGTKLNGKRHGFGTFHYSQGGKYVGNWKQNRMSGKGILYYPDHKVAYDGDWQKDQLSGYGILYNEQVSQLKEAFDYRDFSNVQEYWVKYQGHFSEDNKEGQGKIYLVNGQRFQGNFKEDEIDGEGIFYKYDGGFIKGKWIKNKLIQIL